MSENPFQAPSAASDTPVGDLPPFGRTLRRGFFWGACIGAGLVFLVVLTLGFVVNSWDSSRIPDFLMAMLEGLPGAALLSGLIGSLIAAVAREMRFGRTKR